MLFVVLFALSVAAQQTTPDPPTPSAQAALAPTAPAPQKAEQDRDILKQEQSKHGLGVVPMFNTMSLRPRRRPILPTESAAENRLLHKK
jgi:hypothetical protein